MSQYAILTYHQIAQAPPRPAGFRSLYVPPARFESQMRLLKNLGYRGLSMPDLMPYLRESATANEGECITPPPPAP